MKKNKAVIFDLDGTLFDHHGSVKKALKIIYNSDSSFQKINFNDFISLYHNILNIFFEQYLSREISWKNQRVYRIKALYAYFDIVLDEEEAYNVFLEYESLHKLNWKVYDKANILIESLKRIDYKIGLITNGNRQKQIDKLKKTGLINYFDSIIISGDTEVSKPDSSIFNMSLNELEIKNREALFVGDSLKSDIKGANNSGIDSAYIVREHNKNERITTIIPTYTLFDLKDLQNILLRS